MDASINSRKVAGIGASRQPITALSANVVKGYGKAANAASVKILIAWQCFQPLKANISGMVTGQGATVRRGACLLHSFFTRAADSRAARDWRGNFPG